MEDEVEEIDEEIVLEDDDAGEIESESEDAGAAEDEEGGEEVIQTQAGAAAQRNREDAGVTQRQPGRAEQRIQKLANERKEAKERADRLEAELQAVRNASQTQENYQRQQQEMYERQQAFERASPQEQMAMMLQQAQMQTQRNMQMQQVQMQDQADRLQFGNIVSQNKVAAKYANEVEARLTRLRQTGLNATRQDVLAHLIGEKVMKQQSKAVTTQGAAAKRRVKQQTVPARSARGDTAIGRQRNNDAQARYERLKDLPI